MASSKFFRTVRIFILLAILAGVAMGTYATRMHTTDWNDTLWVVIYPVNADNSSASAKYIDSLDSETFRPVEDFMAQEADSYGLEITKPINIKLAPTVDRLPPEPPPDGNVFKIMWWSLKLRYWTYMNDTYTGPKNIRMYVLFYDPAAHKQLDESMGLQKGMICIARVFANWRMEGKNNIVIAHEMLHTVGATDKYDPATGYPVYPRGFADPDKVPLYPQEVAELMGGRMPISETEAEIPENLYSTIIGEESAREIRWIK